MRFDGEIRFALSLSQVALIVLFFSFVFAGDASKARTLETTRAPLRKTSYPESSSPQRFQTSNPTQNPTFGYYATVNPSDSPQDSYPPYSAPTRAPSIAPTAALPSVVGKKSVATLDINLSFSESGEASNMTCSGLNVLPLQYDDDDYDVDTFLATIAFCNATEELFINSNECFVFYPPSFGNPPLPPISLMIECQAGTNSTVNFFKSGNCTGRGGNFTSWGFSELYNVSSPSTQVLSRSTSIPFENIEVPAVLRIESNLTCRFETRVDGPPDDDGQNEGAAGVLSQAYAVIVPTTVALAVVIYICFTKAKRTKMRAQSVEESVVASFDKKAPPTLAVAVLGEPIGNETTAVSVSSSGFSPFSISFSRVRRPRNQHRGREPSRAAPRTPTPMRTTRTARRTRVRTESGPASLATNPNSRRGTSRVRAVSGPTSDRGLRMRGLSGFFQKDSELYIKFSEITLGSLLGRGAMGRVYEGIYGDSPVAIKEFTGTRSQDSFTRELRVLKALNHPNVIRFYGAVMEEDRIAGSRRMLILELASTSIAEFLASKNISPRDPFASGVTATTLFQWAQQICIGCQFMHSKNVIHFDIKPENLLLDSALNIKICDMGVSRFVSSVARAPSGQNEEGGTPMYSAPEVLVSERDQLTPALDVYSFGIVLWQLLHHGAPFPAEWNVIKLLTMVTKEGFRPELTKDHLPQPLCDAITSCWATAPEERPSFEELVSFFHSLLGPRSVASGGQANGPPFEKGQRVFCWDHDALQFFDNVGGIIDENSPDGIIYPVKHLQSGSISTFIATDLLLDK